jgi:hypothetical protein
MDLPQPEKPRRVRLRPRLEAGVLRDIRRHLLNERGMDRARAHTQGYWKYGATNHPDNDRGQYAE